MFDSDNKDTNSSINSNISRNNNRLKLFETNRNKTIHFLKKALNRYKENDGIDKITELTNITITELKNIKFEIEDNVFNVMNQYIEILLNLKNKLWNSCNKIQRKLYGNLFKSIKNCVDDSKKNMIRIALLPSYEIRAPYNSNSYLIALHEYDYLNNNYIENDEGDEEDLNLLGHDINNIIGNSSTVDNTNFSSNITENSVTVSNIIGNSFTIDNTNFSKENCDKYNLQRGIFQNTHQYVTGELNGIINNSNYKYLDKLKSKVYSLLIDLNRIQAETVSDNISDNYKKYSYVINNFRNTSFKQYINIPEIGSTIDNIINIVNSREEYMNSKLNESLIVRTNH